MRAWTPEGAGPATRGDYRQQWFLMQLIGGDGVFQGGLLHHGVSGEPGYDSSAGAARELPSLRDVIELPRGGAPPRLLRLDAGRGHVSFVRLP